MAVFDSKPLLKYLDLRPVAPLGGRGGAVRFYLLTHGIPYEEELVPLDKWYGGERECVVRAANPAGCLPLLTVGDKTYAQHVAINRFLARKTGEYGKDIEADAVADTAADAHADWRNAWVAVTFGDQKDDTAAVATYRSTRSNHYTTMEWYYAMKPSPSSPYLSGGEVPGFADCLVFNMIRDDGLIHTPPDLSPFPNVKAMHEAMAARPEVKEWAAKFAAQSKAMAA